PAAAARGASAPTTAASRSIDRTSPRPGADEPRSTSWRRPHRLTKAHDARPGTTHEPWCGTCRTIPENPTGEGFTRGLPFLEPNHGATLTGRRPAKPGCGWVGGADAARAYRPATPPGRTPTGSGR